GARPLAFQWQFNSVNLPGATDSSLTLSNITFADAGNYRCIVSNSLGTATTSLASLTVLRPPLLFDLSDGGFVFTNGSAKLRLKGRPGPGPILLYTPPNLVDCLPIYPNPPVLGSWEYLDPIRNQPAKFYGASEGE